MDEDMFETYTEWANDELVWGRGQFNWCRAYSHAEWEKRQSLKDDFNYDIEIPF